MKHPSVSAHSEDDSTPRPSSYSYFTSEIASNPLVTSTHCLATAWAQKYYIAVTERAQANALREIPLAGADSEEGRIRTAHNLLDNLSLASAQAWSLTETLLSSEIRSHCIDPSLLKPLEIAADSRKLFKVALEAYSQGITPQQLSLLISRATGEVRQKYTEKDPRIIGFVSMQFHYTGQKLLEWLTFSEKALFEPYLKVMDDHMYMPLTAAYESAANHDYHSPALSSVQHLLPISTQIAHAVYGKVCQMHPGYKTYSGPLTAERVKISSIRDIEMFQVYLCLCTLEDGIDAVKQELFPLCVMLYPPLKVDWVLVQDMLKLISWEIMERLTPKDVVMLLPYLQTFIRMFSGNVFQAGSTAVDQAPARPSAA
ncbi:MAG: hypothetical protein AAF152_09275 [Cyanobacteria bacterium P01_A01_bin.114]